MEIKTYGPGVMQTTSSKAMWEAIRSAPTRELPKPDENASLDGPLKVEILEPPEMHIEPIIDVKSLGFSESETQKVETFIKDIQRNIDRIVHYFGYRDLGMSVSMVRYYAAHQLDAAKGQRLVDAFEEKIQSVIEADRADDFKYYGAPDNEHAIKLIGSKNLVYYCNQELKDTMYNLYANLDITSESSFEKSFAVAQEKANELMLSYRQDFTELRMNEPLTSSLTLNQYIDVSFRSSHAPSDLNSPIFSHMNYNEQVLRYNQEQWVFYDAMKQLHSQHSGMSFINYIGTA